MIDDTKRSAYALQFGACLHSAADTRATNLDRFNRYLEGYAAYMSEEARQQARAGFAESPEASAMLRWFIELVF